jgi:hypothetical protein
MNQPMSNRRLLIAMSTLVALLMIAGAISFVRYTRTHAPDPRLVAVAPFDIFVSGLESWRVKLATELTAAIAPPLLAVSQDVVRERWHAQARPEIAALDLARSTSATRGLYGRLDPIAGTGDSVRARLIVIDAGTGHVQLVFDGPWPVALLDSLPRALAQRVR